MEEKDRLVLREIILDIGIAYLISCCFLITLAFLQTGGATYCFSEPNRYIVVMEVFLGILAVTVGVIKIRDSVYYCWDIKRRKTKR